MYKYAFNENNENARCLFSLVSVGYEEISIECRVTINGRMLFFFFFFSFFFWTTATNPFRERRGPDAASTHSH